MTTRSLIAALLVGTALAETTLNALFMAQAAYSEADVIWPADHFADSAQRLAMPGRATATRRVILGVRPEDIHLPNPTDDFTIEVSVDFAELTGPNMIVFSRLGGASILASLPPHSHVSVDAVTSFSFSRRDIHIFDQESGQRIEI
jgi:ABC-type sugar transport system ATPase subunit